MFSTPVQSHPKLNMLLPTFYAYALLLAVTQAAPPAQTQQGRVVGGTDATTGQFPHQVSLRYLNSHICGGSVISKRFILTAAHCVSDQESGEVNVWPASHFSVRAGTLDRFAGGTLLNVEEVIVHEEYKNYVNDVAVLRLESALVYSSQLAAIPLASAETPVGAEVQISGWGRLTNGGDLPRELQWNQLTAVSSLRCRTATLIFSASLICLGHASDNGACNGDSGGPAIYNGELVGIAGFVVGGCGSSNPDGYAKVVYHRDWIIKHAEL